MPETHAPKAPPDRRWLLYGMVFVLAVALRVTYSANVGFPVPFGDEEDYRLCANALVAGQAYPIECSTPVMRPPLLPLVMAAMQSLGWGDVALALFQAMCGGIAAVMAMAVTGSLFPGNRAAPWVAGLAFAGHPALVIFAGGVQTEPLFLALCLSGLWLTMHAIGRPHRRDRAVWAVLAGSVWAAACLTRSTALITVAALLAGLAWRRHARVGIWMLAGLIITFAPWVQYTQRTHGDALLVDNGLGWAVWIGNHPGFLPLYEAPVTSPDEVARISNAPVLDDTARVKAELIRTHGYDQLGPKGRSQLWLQLAVERFRQAPDVGLRLLKGKLAVFWRPWVLPGAYPLKAVAVSALLYLGTWSLALLGVMALQGQGSQHWLWLRWTTLLVILGQTAAHTLVHAQGRYRLSSVEPWLIILAACGIGWWLQRLRHGQPAGSDHRAIAEPDRSSALATGP